MSSEPRSSPYRHVASGVGVVVALIGVLAWLGSPVGSIALTGWGEGRPAMVPLTSIAVIGLGLAVVAAALQRRAAVVAAVVVALVPILVGFGANRGWWRVPGWLMPDPALLAPAASGASASSSIVLVTAAALALVLIQVRAVVASQLVMFAVGVLAYASLVAYLLGDRSYLIDRSSFPQTHTALPTAAALLLVAVGAVLAEPSRGMWAWLSSPGPGRFALRRVLVPLVLSPVAAVAAVEVLQLEERLGEPRSNAVVVTFMALLLLVAAVEVVTEIDRLALAANEREVATRLADAQSRVARRAERVSMLATRLSGTSSVQGVVDALIEDGPATLGAELVVVALPDPDRSVLWVTRSLSTDALAAVAEPLDTVEPTPIMDAFRSEQVIWLTEAEQFRRDYPHVVEVADAAGIESLVALPLTGSAGPLGALSVGWTSDVDVSDALRSVVATVAELCAQTVQRAKLTESEHRLIAGLQERLVGAPPTLRSLDLDVRYRPAADVGMGGDWYEVIESPDGTVTVVLGDVSGHGVDAVADMAQARTLIGSLVRQDVALGDILHRVDRLLGRADPVMATVVLVHIDPHAGLVRHTCAGHPPVAFRFADGSVSLSEGGRQPLIGSGIPLGPVEPAVVEFPPGSVVVIYSDGLVERRAENLDVGLERLVRTLSEAPKGPANEIADHLLRELLAGSEALDDTALVVVRRGMSLSTGSAAPAAVASPAPEV